MRSPALIPAESYRLTLRGICSRILQLLARSAPGTKSLRVWLHRLRGVKIGKDVAIGYDVVLETQFPSFITLGDRCFIGIRTCIIAHFKEMTGVTLEEDVFLGPGVLVLPGVKIGRGSVVTGGSVVTASVPPMTVVQGNPAKPVARAGIPLVDDEVELQEFLQHVTPIH